MAKDYDKYSDFLSHYREQLKIPNFMTEKLSCWTYSDMKREFAKSIELFSKNGFADESISLAYRSIVLKLYHGDDKISTMTENVMANTIRVSEALKVKDTETLSEIGKPYREQIAKFKNSPTHGLVIKRDEGEALVRDIKTALNELRGVKPAPPKEEPTELELPGFKSMSVRVDSTKKMPYPTDSDRKMKERLSDRAYKMLTEYKRSEEIIDLDFLENNYLRPNGFKLTDGLREFIEIYDGRVFAWRSTSFFIDYPFSGNSFNGCSIDLAITWANHFCGDKYFINTMSEFVPPYLGPMIGSDGMLHCYGEEYCSNYPELKPISPEDFFEGQAHEYYKDKLLLERRRELENKYLIPEIRTASM